MITSRSADAPAVSLRPVTQEITVPIASNIDIVNARQWGRTLAFQGGCSPIIRKRITITRVSGS